MKLLFYFYVQGFACNHLVTTPPRWALFLWWRCCQTHENTILITVVEQSFNAKVNNRKLKLPYRYTDLEIKKQNMVSRRATPHIKESPRTTENSASLTK
jgi:hypothetical protein